jgi:hypothetical protein
MIETAHWKLAIEVQPAGWRFAAGVTWLAGWLWSPQNRIVTDLRCWIDGRCFLANWGLPKPGLDEVYLRRPGPPYLGFTLPLEPHAGATPAPPRGARPDQRNGRELFRTPITVAADAGRLSAAARFPRPCWAALLDPLLRLHQRAPGPAAGHPRRPGGLRRAGPSRCNCAAQPAVPRRARGAARHSAGCATAASPSPAGSRTGTSENHAPHRHRSIPCTRAPCSTASRRSDVGAKA